MTTASNSGCLTQSPEHVWAWQHHHHTKVELCQGFATLKVANPWHSKKHRTHIGSLPQSDSLLLSFLRFLLLFFLCLLFLSCIHVKHVIYQVIYHMHAVCVWKHAVNLTFLCLCFLLLLLEASLCFLFLSFSCSGNHFTSAYLLQLLSACKARHTYVTAKSCKTR